MSGALEIGVIGSSQFIAGFALAGVRHCFVSNPATSRDDIDLMLQPELELGILIVDEELLREWSAHEKEQLLLRVSPVVMFISQHQQITLASQVRKALGIDLASISTQPKLTANPAIAIEKEK